MSRTKWVIEGDDNATLEVEGHKFAAGDSGAPMLCSMLCKTMGRHVHVDACRARSGKSCKGEGIQHMKGQKEVDAYDWVTHRLFWARSGETVFHIEAQL
jgi:hypothetical protein